jgi:hypothetical protein
MKNTPIRLALACLLAGALSACEQENVEEKFFSDAPGQEFYQLQVAPLLEAKCFSCHTYHQSPSTRYDTYLKAAGAINDIVARVTASNSAIMPPIGGGTPLTAAEIAVFQNFQQQLSGTSAHGINISWTAYKFPGIDRRAGVSGTFDEIFYSYKHPEADNIYDYLADAEVTINTASVNVGNDPEKIGNLRHHFFAVFSPTIHAKVLGIDPQARSAQVMVTMNGISREVAFSIDDDGENLAFSGRLADIVADWGAAPALEKLAEVCGDYHEGVVWPDVDLLLRIERYRDLL